MSFKSLIGKEIGTVVEGQENKIGKLERVVPDRKNERYRFMFENGYELVIPEPVFFQHTLLKIDEECIYFEYSPELVLSGMLAYCLFETYGFPLELAEDEMDRIGVRLDEEGFYIMEELSRRRNKGTFKGKNAFG